MTELTHEEFLMSFEVSADQAPADKAAVDSYLKQRDDEEFVRTAAQMIQVNTSDASKVIGMSVELAAGACGATADFRKKLLLSMNFNTLMLLLDRIGYNLAMLAQGRHITGEGSPSGKPEIDDPVKGPVFEMFNLRFPNWIAPERQHELDIEAAIKVASERANRSCPDLPCNLETALRWAVNALEVDFKILRRAFVDFLQMAVLSAEEEEDFKRELASLVQQIKSSQGKENAGQIRAREIKKILNDNERSKRNRSMFKPGKGKTRISKKIADNVKQIMAECWDRPNSVWQEQQLANIAANFHPFWSLHRSKYLKLAKSKSSRNKESGRLAPKSRMYKIWLDRVEDFVRLFGDQVHQNVDEDKWNQCIEEFSLMLAKDRRTQKKIAGFITTLYPHATGMAAVEKIADLVGLLVKEKINAVDADTIRSCLERLQPLRTQPPWKPSASNPNPL